MLYLKKPAGGGVMSSIMWWVLGFLFYLMLVCMFTVVPMVLLLNIKRFRKRLTEFQLYVWTLIVATLTLILVVDMTIITVFFLKVPWTDSRAFRIWGALFPVLIGLIGEIWLYHKKQREKKLKEEHG